MLDLAPPQTMAIEPRDYQLEGVRFLLNSKRAILADDMGLGKTGQAYLTWKAAGLPGPALIIARPNAQVAWISQAEQWGVQCPLSISGTQKQRAQEWLDVDETSLVTCTLQTLMQDHNRFLLPKKWGFIIYDEYQRGIINRKTQSYKFVKQQLKSDYLLLLSGTPMRKGFQDLWAPLNILDPKGFSSYWRFVQTFGYTQLNEWGAWEVLGLKDPQVLANRIKHLYLRRTKQDVLPELPPKVRITDHILQMLPQQRKMYDELVEKMIMELPSGDHVITPSTLSRITRLRQLLVTPQIFDPSAEPGAIIEHLGELLEETDDRHFVIFTPFVAAIDPIRHYLLNQCKIPLTSVITLQGGLSAEEVRDRINYFREVKGICVCSVQYAESFELTPACWAYFAGFSWSAIDNLQAEDRIHRMTTTNPCFYYYPQHQNCIDQELMMPVLDNKASEILKVYKSTQALRDLLIRSRDH